MTTTPYPQTRHITTPDGVPRHEKLVDGQWIPATTDDVTPPTPQLSAHVRRVLGDLAPR